jgi:hypothetical protein
MVALARRHRAPGLDLEDDVVDPIGQSDEVYARSFQQILRGLGPLIRLATTRRVLIVRRPWRSVCGIRWRADTASRYLLVFIGCGVLFVGVYDRRRPYGLLVRS